MYKNKKILAIIPARGGSKGMPGKNIKTILRRPLIYWTIQAAKNSAYLDKIIVSTDSPEIADLSKKYGANVPFLRPGRLSTDNASSTDVVIHAIEFLENRGEKFDIVIVLQPTSPLRTCEDINKAIKMLFRKKAMVIISVTEAVKSPLWMNTLPIDGRMDNFLSPKLKNKNRQNLPRYYQLNGAIFLGHIGHVIRNKGFYCDRTFAYIMPKERSLDIDDIYDFKFAETLLEDARTNYIKDTKR